MSGSRLLPCVLLMLFAVEVEADHPHYFNIPAQPLPRAVEAFSKEGGGVDFYVGRRAFKACRRYVVQPLVGWMTAQTAWTKLTAPICWPSGVVLGKRKGPVYMLDHPWVLKLAADPQSPNYAECSCREIIEPKLEVPQINVAQPQLAFTDALAVRRPNSDRLNLDSTVVAGNRELPKVLHIVPWKKADPADPPAPSFDTLLNEALMPLDREVFRREVAYYGEVRGAP